MHLKCRNIKYFRVKVKSFKCYGVGLFANEHYDDRGNWIIHRVSTEKCTGIYGGWWTTASNTAKLKHDCEYMSHYEAMILQYRRSKKDCDLHLGRLLTCVGIWQPP